MPHHNKYMADAYAWNRLRWYVRIPIKGAVFGLTLLFVCFPYPGRLVKHLAHWKDPNALVEPDAPALRPLTLELRSRMTDGLEPRHALRIVEQYVYEKVPYEWDWITWGTADYLPTVTEVLEKGKEDCDGRAVVAASLLQSLGYDAWLVTDLAHMWVKTEQGETMGPGKEKAVEATEDGLRLHVSALAQLPQALAYGIAVFPFGRELIVLLVTWLLLLRSRMGVTCHASGFILLLAGLLLLRAGSQDYYNPSAWLQGASVIALGGGLAVLTLWPRLMQSKVPPAGDLPTIGAA